MKWSMSLIMLIGMLIASLGPIATASADGLPPAWGSVTINGQKFEMAWDESTQRLWMPGFDQAKAANATAPATANIHANNQPVIVHVFGRNVYLLPGQDWFGSFVTNDPSFGFDAIIGARPDPLTLQGWGSVTINGQKFELEWDDNGRLWMPWFDQVKSMNSTMPVLANVHANSARIIVNALGGQFYIDPGQDWFYEFIVEDPSFGFDAKVW